MRLPLKRFSQYIINQYNLQKNTKKWLGLRPDLQHNIRPSTS